MRTGALTLLIDCALRLSMKILGYHTVEDRNNPDVIEATGGFKCVDKKAFLGEGIYFWDNHLDYAHFWGETRYPSGYVICEVSIELSAESFFDLIGNREDQIYLLQQYDELNAKFECKDWPIGRFISLLVALNGKPQYSGIFDYSAIRAMDYAARRTTSNIPFVDGKHHFTNLSPVYIVCVIGTAGITFQNFRIIFPDYYV